MNSSPWPLVKRVIGYFVTLLLIVSLCLVSPAPVQAGNPIDYVLKQIALRLNPPKGPSPNRRSGGFGRGDSCPIEVDLPLTALAIAPPSNQTEKSRLKMGRTQYGGETTEASPGFWFYVPYTRFTSEGYAQFMVLDEARQPLFEQPVRLELADQPGIISVNLPQQQALQIKHPYFWYFSVICDRDRPSRNPSVNGWIQRVPSTPGVPDGQNYDVWYDLLNALATARRQSPHRLDLQIAWAQLMKNNKGLEKLAQKELR